MTSTLGLAYGYHDSAIALVDENEILYAAHEERFTRIKFDNSFPVSALKDLGKTFDLKKLKNVVYYEKPFKKFERQINSLIQLPLRDLFSFPENVASLRKLFQTSDKYINKQLKNTLEIEKQLPVYYSSHHRSHAAASFYTSEFESSLILVADAVGEFESTSLWIGKGNILTQIYSQNFPNSYGIFYSAITSLLGFKVNTGEFKLMGLAPYGEPTYLETLQNVMTLNDDNSMTLNPKYINPFSSHRLFTKKLETLLGSKMRKDSEALLQKHADIAISSQKILENQIIALVSRALENFKLDKLCVSGGVGLNCVLNTKFSKLVGHKNFYSFSASGDAGTALGGALAFLANDKSNKSSKRWGHKGSILGKCWTNDEIEQVLNKFDLHYKRMSQNEIGFKVAQLINEGAIIGLFHGKEEFGPRALGNRSIIADARTKFGQILINEQIKFRESFRPFAPICLEDRIKDYFVEDISDPFMLRINFVRDFKTLDIHKNNSLTDKNKAILIKQRLEGFDSYIHSITHVDGSSRVQSIKRDDPRMITKILIEFERLTDLPILINTSFNVRGEPIVNSPFDALQCFATTGLSHLVIGDFMVDKMKNADMKNIFKVQLKYD